MKKLFIGLTFLGFFSIAIPTAKAEIDPCHYEKIICADGRTTSIKVCCSEDYDFWYDLFCDCSD